MTGFGQAAQAHQAEAFPDVGRGRKRAVAPTERRHCRVGRPLIAESNRRFSFQVGNHVANVKSGRRHSAVVQVDPSSRAVSDDRLARMAIAVSGDQGLVRQAVGQLFHAAYGRDELLHRRRPPLVQQRQLLTDSPRAIERDAAFVQLAKRDTHLECSSGETLVRGLVEHHAIDPFHEGNMTGGIDAQGARHQVADPRALERLESAIVSSGARAGEHLQYCSASVRRSYLGCDATPRKVAQQADDLRTWRNGLGMVRPRGESLIGYGGMIKRPLHCGHTPWRPQRS